MRSMEEARSSQNGKSTWDVSSTEPASYTANETSGTWGKFYLFPPPIVQAGGAPFPSRLWLVLSNASQESSYGDTLSDIACVETSMMFGTGYGA
jgi:hypothetical protein